MNKVNTEPIDMCGNTWDFYHLAEAELLDRLGLKDVMLVSIRPESDEGYLISVIIKA